MYDNRKILNRDVVDTIRKFFGEKVFETLIRDNVSLAEAPAQRKDIFTYSPNSIGAQDYMNLCKEILSRISVPV
jgi:chromosome partitioning protein